MIRLDDWTWTTRAATALGLAALWSLTALVVWAVGQVITLALAVLGCAL